MIEKLVRNRFLTLPSFAQVPPAREDGFPDGFLRIPDRVFRIEESTRSGPFYNPGKTSNVVVGAHADKAHRSFRWLPWVAGEVTCVPLAGPDVLTGLMTGCWLTIFSMDGIRYVAHIGTSDNPDSKESVAAKAAWRHAVTVGNIVPVASFKPTSQLPNDLNTNGEAVEFYGGIATSGAMSTVVMTFPRGAGQGVRRIALVHPQRTTPDVTGF